MNPRRWIEASAINQVKILTNRGIFEVLKIGIIITNWFGWWSIVWEEPIQGLSRFHERKTLI